MNSKGKILVVEDEKSLNDVMCILLEDEGYNVISAYDGKEALTAINKDIFDIVITDIKMPYFDGFEILKKVLEISPETIVLMITAYGTAEDAVEAMKQGAYDYIHKPFKIDEIRLVIKNAIEKRYLSKQVKTLKRQIEKTYKVENIIGKSPKMQDILTSLPRLSESQLNVLVTGESGSGKELIAHALHNLSNRKDKAFITVNCAAFPEGLLESELFGHMKGSFTGAAINKEGLFEVADDGSIFLDEIGDMPINLQAKLLRVLEDGSFRRIGGIKDVKVDVRIISATNKNLKQEVEAGSFRQDLFYRLNVINVHIPALRDRKEDIPLLIDWFKEQGGYRDRRFTQQAIDTLIAYPWYGNVRELKNAMERIFTFADSPVITKDALPQEIRDFTPLALNKPQTDSAVEIPNVGVNLDKILEDIEKQYLLKALDKAKGVKTEAAPL
ncbi:two component sigma-54 specific Fis family transcriptional regulator, partial [Candidatus Magnetoovum chiemensis]